MSKTKIILDKEYFTAEMTTDFLKDFELACKTMEVDLFVKLFIKYDLYYNEEYQEVLDLIKLITNDWNKPELGTELIEVSKFDSKCIFCNIGKKVNGYKWTYMHKLDTFPRNRFVYESQIAFYFDFQDHHLIEFGVCNGYMNKEEIEKLNA